MELFSTPWWSALASIVLIDLVLAGDNAIVIALAARRLPMPIQRRAILWGTLGAIVVRAAMTIGVVWLLTLPGLRLVGGLALLWIAWKLVTDGDAPKPHEEPAAVTFWGAMQTIVVADALMGIDNVIGVAGAARESMTLVLIGLLVSVPIVVSGSAMVLKLVHRFPQIIVAGGAVLAWTAAQMIVAEPLLAPLFAAPGTLHDAARWSTYALAIAGVLGLAWWQRR
ncbi:MAG: TerC family protein [Proteobacteria bacterium]|nr:TerC family protein [Pseudomonadota bacterium]